MLIHGRNGAFAVLAVTAMALFAPGVASAHHDLVIYKAEAHVDLESDEKTVSVSCDAGDHALDGMWRIDHADQDDYIDDLDNIIGAVDVLKATPTSDSTYSFAFVKNAIGRAQVKIFVTCLKSKTQGGSHQHTFITGGAPNVGSFFRSDGVTPGFETSAPATVTGTGGLVKSSFSAAACPANFLLVSPGFESSNYRDAAAVLTDPSPGMMRIYESNHVTNPRNWTWKFENSALPLNYTTDVVVKWRCLKIKLPVDGFDKHKLVPKFKSPVFFNPKKHKVSEGQYHCGSHYKAIVAGFQIPEDLVNDQSNYNTDGTGLKFWVPPAFAFNNIFYMGMDPRPKTRAYRFANRSTTTTWPVKLTALCLNYRTT